MSVCELLMDTVPYCNLKISTQSIIYIISSIVFFLCVCLFLKKSSLNVCLNKQNTRILEGPFLINTCLTGLWEMEPVVDYFLNARDSFGDLLPW